jgi:hypothetical protein
MSARNYNKEMAQQAKSQIISSQETPRAEYYATIRGPNYENRRNVISREDYALLLKEQICMKT